MVVSETHIVQFGVGLFDIIPEIRSLYLTLSNVNIKNETVPLGFFFFCIFSSDNLLDVS